MQTIHIQSYNMVDFLIEVEKNIKNGYTFDFVSIGNFPQLVGGTFIVGMILDDPQKVEEQQEPNTEEIVVNPEDTVNTPENVQQEPEVQPVAEGTQEEVQAAVEAPKKAGRPAKGK